MIDRFEMFVRSTHLKIGVNESIEGSFPLLDREGIDNDNEHDGD